MTHCTRPVLRALPETIDTFFGLHGERNSGFVAALVAGGHFDENFLLYVSVEKCCLHVQHVDLVVQPPRRLQVPSGCFIVYSVCLDLVYLAGANDVLSVRNCTQVMRASSYTPCFSRFAISLSEATFQRAARGRVIAYLKVFGIYSLFSSPEKLPSALVATYAHSILKLAFSVWCAMSSV